MPTWERMKLQTENCLWRALSKACQIQIESSYCSWQDQEIVDKNITKIHTWVYLPACALFHRLKIFSNAHTFWRVHRLEPRFSKWGLWRTTSGRWGFVVFCFFLNHIFTCESRDYSNVHTSVRVWERHEWWAMSLAVWRRICSLSVKWDIEPNNQENKIEEWPRPLSQSLAILLVNLRCWNLFILDFLSISIFHTDWSFRETTLPSNGNLTML